MRTISSCWTSDRHVSMKEVVSILSCRVAFDPSAKLPSSLCWPCIHVKADLSKSGSEYLCNVMEERAWMVNAVSLKLKKRIPKYLRKSSSKNSLEETTWRPMSRPRHGRIRRLSGNSECSARSRSSWCFPCRSIFWHTGRDGIVPAQWQD